MNSYSRLGVRRVINAFETLSSVGGTRIRPAVLEAMQQASGQFVFLQELHRAAGERIAALTHNEAAAVTNGASAGLLLAANACLEHAGSRRSLTLPVADAVRIQVIVQRCQYSPYVPNITQVGAEIVEVGYAHHATPEEVLVSAFNERTAAVMFTAGRPYERHAVPLDRVIALSHERRVPVIVDGAALLPPLENLRNYTEMGADLAVFSGGKGLRGPQDSGVVVGRRDLVERIHQVNSPAHGLGRALKVTKEAVVGFLVALECAMAEDQDALYEELQGRATAIDAGLEGVPGIRSWILPDGRQGQPCPRTVVQLLPDSGWERGRFIAALASTDPAILVGPLDERSDCFYLNPRDLEEEEIELVVAQVRELLTTGSEQR